MSSRRSARRVWSAAAALAGLALPLESTGASDEALLAATDLFARAPAELRLEIVVGPPGRTIAFELWRKGPDLLLIRPLTGGESGRYYLRRGDDLFLLARGAKRPVPMTGSLPVLAGAGLAEMTGLDLARDYSIVALTETRGIVSFDLVARTPRAAAPRLTWVVDRAGRRPLRAELRAADGKPVRLLEFSDWRDVARLIPERIVAKDLVRGGAPIEMRVRVFEALALPEGLFALDDPSERDRRFPR